jgi:DNA (cytosine-5)-methyltransferase 1
MAKKATGVEPNKSQAMNKGGQQGTKRAIRSISAVELFCGIGGFRSACDHHGVRTVWANDLCSKASEVYRDQFGDKEIREGDVAGFVDDIPSHDLLTGGFPCQPFSSAGKKRGINDPRGTLFQTIVDVLRNKQPRMFVLENVKRLLTMEKGIHFATIISSLSELDYRIEWRLLNAMHFGVPQNRQRVFVVGTRKNQPSRIHLAPIDDLQQMTRNQIDRFSEQGSWKSIERHEVRFPNWGIAECGRFFAADLDDFSAQERLVTLDAVLEREVDEEFDFTESTLRRLPANTPVNKLIEGVEILSNQKGGARMGYTIFGTKGVAPTLTSTTSRHYERYKIGDRYRRLTNIEYARIQGFPDDHCRVVRVYDQYALLGNAVPPCMASWVIGRILDPKSAVFFRFQNPRVRARDALHR